MIEFLEGGRDGIYKQGNRLYRPTSIWAKSIHGFLDYLIENGFLKAPKPFEVDRDGKEILSFLAGDVHNGLLPIEAKGDDVLVALARIMKEYHDIGAKYISHLNGDEKWRLPRREPAETMCHGDLAPYNVVMNGKEIVGIIDFDMLHPGPRMWDIAYTLYRFVPLMDSKEPGEYSTREEKLRRTRLFLDAYGLEDVSMNEAFEWIRIRVSYLVEYIESEAANGSLTFQKNIEDGHVDIYNRDIKFVQSLMT